MYRLPKQIIKKNDHIHQSSKEVIQLLFKDSSYHQHIPWFDRGMNFGKEDLMGL